MQITSIINFDAQLIFKQINTISFHAHVVAGAFAIWIFSWLWHDFIIVKLWLKWTGMSLKEAQSLHKGKLIQDLGLYLFSKLFLSYVCMLLALALQVHTISQALILSITASIGVIFPIGVGPVIFENRHTGLWVLSSTLISLSVTALLLIQLI